MSIFNLFHDDNVIAATENFQGFLDNSTNGVVFFDKNLLISFVSKTAVHLYDSHQQNFAHAAPAFNLRNPVNVKLTDLPLIPRQALDELAYNKSWSAMLNLDTEICHMAVIPFLDKQNQFNGGMLEFWWATDYQKMHEIATRSQSVFDEMTVPIMTCDVNRIITALNPAVHKLLSNYQHALQNIFPHFNPDNLIGRCIDDFHKNPETQKRIFADPNKRIPYKARIKVLELIFDLTVFPIKDEKGKLNGYAVEWLDATGTVSTINEIERVALQIVEGKLNERIDVSKFDGDLRHLASAVNQMLETIVQPLNVAADYVDQISKGHIPAKITDAYNGDFNAIKNNLNTCIDAINNLVADTNMLSLSAVEGQLQTRADASKHFGDYRKIVAGINDTLDGVILPVTEAVEVLHLVEQGDLTRTVVGNYKGQLNDFKITVNNTIAKLSSTISDVINSADQLGNASEQISATSQSLSQASSEQAAGVEQTSASIEEMASSINQNAENAKVTDGMAAKAANEASEGGIAVRQTVDAMKQIANKIGIIDDIAYQTNMLALNAAIEAARAGDHGKGFAVVAAEVRKLAERSQVAAQEIGTLAETSVKTAERAGKLLDEIVPSISKTSDLVQEIAASSQEQSAGVSQINKAMNQMNQTTQQNAAASEELAATAEEMTGQVGQLQELMSFFRINNHHSAHTHLASKPAKHVEKLGGSHFHSSRHADNAEFDLSKFERF